jgi:AhpD family alkylhydroperoxidase
MTRLQLGPGLPEAYKSLLAVHQTVQQAAADAGLDARLLELVKIRASQLNGCAFCLDMHTTDARKLGETERRLNLVAAWRETELFSEQERAALALTEAMTRLAEHRDVPDDVYDAALAVFTEEQYAVVGWAATVINAFNRLGVTSRKPLPAS